MADVETITMNGPGSRAVKEHVARNGSQLRRRFNWRVAPFLWLLILFVVALLSMTSPIGMICGLALFLKGFLHFAVISFRDRYYEYKHAHYDRDSVTFSAEPNRFRWKRWVYRIEYQDIAQVRQRQGRLIFIFNDATSFDLPERVNFSEVIRLPSNSVPSHESTLEGYLDILFHIHRALSARASYLIPFRKPLPGDRHSRKDVLGSCVLVMARKENFEEIGRKVLWDDVSRNEDGGLGSLLTVIWVLSLVFTIIWGWIIAIMGFVWLIHLVLHGSVAGANAELGVEDYSEVLFHGGIFVSLLTVFLVFYGLWAIYKRWLDRRVGNKINRKYWLDPPAARHQEEL